MTDRFVELAEACCTLGDLRQLLADACGELGFSYFALLHHSSLAEPGGSQVRIDSYPEGWAEELVRSGLALDDPVHLASRRTAAGFAWGELERLIPLSRRHKIILSRSRSFGLGDGFTVPINVPGEPSGSCSFAVRSGQTLPFARLRSAEQIGAHAFNAARRILPVPSPAGRPHLSKRELDCLRLVAQGKTDSEIAIILGISADTARQYVKRARAAYDVVSRTQLVVHSLRDEWLRIEDAIPPRRLSSTGASTGLPRR